MVMNHTIYFNAAQNMSQLKEKSIDLVVTSPPYPMIEMWDEIMSNQNPDTHRQDQKLVKKRAVPIKDSPL